ncbi:methionine/alanine import family NSS transporter small subunit [Streptomyces globisporus]|uniref:Methionine/alanine import family NSS transporter small subunit n=1 Tax=Streptomyces globisporus TaxID=1908 RepID=A0A423UYT9_STRGL|nr:MULTISPECIES: methionine/alanine import family NSS transporter small subunit [Streptomyces]ROV67516.1 methionine/alanine import family NSS transporter small subunit [Streptomyces globisporus]
MSTSAIIMMIISMLIVWGGLVAAILRLRQHPQPQDELPPGAHRAE